MEPTNNQRKSQKLWVLFVFLLALLTYPLLSIFSVPVLVSGIPVLFLYIFGIWILGIFFIYLLTSKTEKKDLDL